VFYGDSRTEQWPFPQDDGRFQFINRGIGGQTSVQVLGRFDAQVVPLQPDSLVIQVGVNDLKNLGLFPEQHAAILTNCKDAIRQLVSRAGDCGVRVILTTIFPIGDLSWERRFFWRMFIAELPLMQAIDEVNAFLRTLQSERVTILNTQAILADQRGRVKKEFQQDLLHLNQTGYTALNQALRTILAAA
jgi:lysophospholipase L1-like esterase